VSYNQLEYTFELSKKGKTIITTTALLTDGRVLPILCLMDTGADLPIWFSGEEALKEHFPDAKNAGKTTDIYGLGKGPNTGATVWVIPKFRLLDLNGYSITFRNLTVVLIPNKRYLFHMILPVTMFNHARFSFDYLSDPIKPILTINTNSNMFEVKECYNDDKLLSKIQVLTQEEAEAERKNKTVEEIGETNNLQPINSFI